MAAGKVVDVGPRGGGVGDAGLRILVSIATLDNYGALRHHVAPWFLAPQRQISDAAVWIHHLYHVLGLC